MDALFDKIWREDARRSFEDRAAGPIFKVLFLGHSTLITEEVFPALAARLDTPEFQRRVIDAHRRICERKRESVLDDARKCEAAGRNANFYTRLLPALDAALAIDSMDAYLDALRDPAGTHPRIAEALADTYAELNDARDGRAYVAAHYPLYEIGSMLYGQYEDKRAAFEQFDRPCAATLRAGYRAQGIDLDATDPQFRKYGLLSLDGHFTVFNGKTSRTLVDERLGQHFWIGVPGVLLAALEHALAAGWVPRIAFEIGAVTAHAPSLEALEYGAVFRFEALRLPAVSKLYDETRYDDALWIQVDAASPASMTFEELCVDFPMLDGHVLTQVVHLEFFEDRGQYFISHLDHEYILYTEEAHARRRFDASVKGHRKRKTFKIDQARIPFDFRFEGRYFLYLVLDAYFHNKRLIEEYFSDVCARPAAST